MSNNRKRRDDVGRDIYQRQRGSLQRYNDAEHEEYKLFRMYERILGELAMNRFRWSGFPDYVDLRYLEVTMHQHGLVVVFKDTGTTKRPGTDRIYALRGSPGGQMTVTENYTSFILASPGVEQIVPSRTLSARLCVPIWSNFLRSTDWDIISTYARKLANIDRTIEINMKNARRTKVLVYDENTRLSADNINRQLDNGDASIAVKFDLSNMVTALDLGVTPDSLEKLSILRGRLWSEAMGLLGINNANQDKKERLVESEVESNDDQIDNMRRVNLNARQFACIEMRKKFPDDLGKVWVEFHSDIDAEAQQMAENLGIDTSIPLPWPLGELTNSEEKGSANG